MKVTYIGHSGFLLETADCYYIFDYYKGEVPKLSLEKPVVVFASHFHQDHYQAGIFALLKERGMQVQGVLAEDIDPADHPEGVQILKVCANEEYTLENGAKIRTLLSTDSGVAYIVETGEGRIYHAGDLNDWYWEGEPDNDIMCANYRHEIDKLKGIPLDIAFVVLDPRQEAHYADGMLYFLEHTKSAKVYPMHYWEKPTIIRTFVAEYPQYKDIIQFTE